LDLFGNLAFCGNVGSFANAASKAAVIVEQFGEW
jgi:hypothetical protein